jgi:nucleoside-diphosphate-sugar epimerase
MNNLIAVTGATGYVGRFVVAELLRQGMTVRALARPESDRGGFAGSIEWINASLRSGEALARLVKDAGAVVHLAYEHVPGRYRGGEGEDLAGWLDANVSGSLRLLTAARDAGVQKFIFLSSRAVFSRTEPGRDLDESHPISPDTHYGAYKAAAESFLHSFARVEKMQTCSIRATGVYGVTWPVERSKWWGLVNAVVRGEPITSNGGGTEVYGGDVARVIWALLNQPEMNIDTVHLSDLYVSHREVVRLARDISSIPGDLPPEPSKPPENVMVSRNLSQLGITLSGLPAVEATVTELVRLAQTKIREA